MQGWAAGDSLGWAVWPYQAGALPTPPARLATKGFAWCCLHRAEVERYRTETAAAANDDRTQQLRVLGMELAAVEEQVGVGGPSC